MVSYWELRSGVTLKHSNRSLGQTQQKKGNWLPCSTADADAKPIRLLTFEVTDISKIDCDLHGD